MPPHPDCHCQQCHGDKGNVYQYFLFFLADLTMHNVQTIGHCATLLREGIKCRVTTATRMNQHSSRSHAIFTVWIKARL